MRARGEIHFCHHGGQRTAPAWAGIAFIQRRLTSAIAVLALLIFCSAGIASTTTTKSSDTVVSVDVLTATAISAGGCPSGTANQTAFGTLTVSSQNVTTSDCTVTFGSSNETALLKGLQADRAGTAMRQQGANFTTTMTKLGNFKGMTKLSSTAALAVGEGGAVYSSTDSGDTWTQVATTGISGDINGVWAASATVVFAVAGNNIYKSTDGGTNWTSQHDAGATMYGVHGIDTNTVWAVGNSGTIRSTTNGGTNWNTQTSPQTNGLKSVFAVDASNVYAAGGAEHIIKTTNGGTNWNDSQTPVGSDACNAIHAFSSSSVLVACENGKVFRTTNGGTNWSDVMTSGTSAFHSLSFSDANNGLVVGRQGSPKIWKTTDAGANWTQIATMKSSATNLYSSVWLTSTTYLVGGEAQAIWKTTDSGTTWSNPADWSTLPLNAVDASGDRVWAAGEMGRILRSADGGGTWTPQGTRPNERYLSVSAISATTGWIAGEGGVIRKTTNSGTTWSSQSSGTSSDLYSIDSSDGDVAWVVGPSGLIRTTRDGGNTWRSQTSGTANDLNDVVALSDKDAWIVGDGDTVLKTANGGTTWTAQNTGTTGVNFERISAPNASDAFVTASGSADVYITTNGGTNWSADANSSAQTKLGVTALSDRNVVVAATSNDEWTYRYGSTTFSDMTATGGTDGLLTDITQPDQSATVSVRDAGSIRQSIGGQTIPDYGTNNWAGTGSLFGGCLRSVASGATAQWTTNATCPDSDGAYWNPFKADAADAGAVVARSLSSGTTNATANLRFGMQVSGTQLAADYAADLEFQVVAPNV